MVASLPEVWAHVAPWVIPEPPIRVIGFIKAFHLGERTYECCADHVRYINWKMQASVAIDAIYAVSRYKWQYTWQETERLLASSVTAAHRRD